MRMFPHEKLTCYRLSLSVVTVCDRIANRHRRRHGGLARSLMSAAFNTTCKIARSSLAGPPEEWQPEVDIAMDAITEVLRVLGRLRDAVPRDPDVETALELAERVQEAAIAELGPVPAMLRRLERDG